MSHFSGNLRVKLQSSLKHYTLLVGTVRFNFRLAGAWLLSESISTTSQTPSTVQNESTISHFNYFNISFLHCWKCNTAL